MSLYATCPCGIPEGLDMIHLRTDCPLYGTPNPQPTTSTHFEEEARSCATH